MTSLEDRVAALEAAVAELTQPEPEFMAYVRTETLDGPILTVRLTHQPTGVTAAARDRTEAVYKLRQAIAGHTRRQYDLQEAERRRLRKLHTESSTP